MTGHVPLCHVNYPRDLFVLASLMNTSSCFFKEDILFSQQITVSWRQGLLGDRKTDPGSDRIKKFNVCLNLPSTAVLIIDKPYSLNSQVPIIPQSKNQLGNSRISNKTVTKITLASLSSFLSFSRVGDNVSIWRQSTTLCCRNQGHRDLQLGRGKTSS